MYVRVQINFGTSTFHMEKHHMKFHLLWPTYDMCLNVNQKTQKYNYNYNHLLRLSQVRWFGKDFGTIMAGTKGDATSSNFVKYLTHTLRKTDRERGMKQDRERAIEWEGYEERQRKNE